MKPFKIVNHNKKAKNRTAIADYDENGIPITDKDVEHWVKCAENLDFSDFEDVGAPINRLPCPMNQTEQTNPRILNHAKHITLKPAKQAVKT